MFLFLNLLSESFGNDLVHSTFFLTKPQHLIRPEDVSSQIGRVIKHLSLEEYAWEFTDDMLLVHPQASIHALDSILSVLVSAGAIQSSEVVETQNAIESKKGQEATILEILPASLSPKIKTFDQMQADGWFPSF